MNFIEFRNRFLTLACFTTNQEYASHPEFNRNNPDHWVKKGYIIEDKHIQLDFGEFSFKN